MPDERPRAAPWPAPRGRCRCGHYPTDHMLTRPVGSTSNFRLEPSGPCSICGEAGCKLYAPGAPAGAPG